MAETITLTTPPVAAVLVDYQVVYLELDWEHARIVVKLRGPDNQRLAHNYLGATAITLMRQLNKLDLSVKSLHRRVLERLVADGVLSGPIAGAPD